MLPIHTLDDVNYTVNANFNHCGTSGAWSCTVDFRPSWQGDCKQAAALKLRELILVGAQPREFTIWLVHVPSSQRDAQSLANHAVLVQNATGMVLDLMTNLVESRSLKERYEGFTFIAPCDTCGDMARRSAEIERRR